MAKVTGIIGERKYGIWFVRVQFDSGIFLEGSGETFSWAVENAMTLRPLGHDSAWEQSA